MKKTILVLSSVVLFFSCTKKEPIVCDATISGNWSDGTASYSIMDSDSVLSVYFDNQIHSPSKEGITIEYKKAISNDTTFCFSGNMYPTFYFIVGCNTVTGGVVEWQNIETQGQFKKITK